MWLAAWLAATASGVPSATMAPPSFPPSGPRSTIQSAAVMTSRLAGYSRALFALFTLDQTLESFLRGHVAAFEALGGSARTLVYDNLRSAVLDRRGTAIQFHPRLLELAGHYHFAPRPCTPARGNEKGYASHCTSLDGCDVDRCSRSQRLSPFHA